MGEVFCRREILLAGAMVDGRGRCRNDLRMRVHSLGVRKKGVRKGRERQVRVPFGRTCQSRHSNLINMFQVSFECIDNVLLGVSKECLPRRLR